MERCISSLAMQKTFEKKFLLGHPIHLSDKPNDIRYDTMVKMLITITELAILEKHPLKHCMQE